MTFSAAGQRINSQSIRLLRILGIFTAVIVPPFRYILPADAVDPMWARFLVSALALSLVIVSFVWPRMRLVAREVSYLLGFAITGWMLTLAVANHLTQEYSSSYYIMLFATLMLFRDKSWLIGFVLFNGIVVSVSMVFVTDPVFEPITFVAMVFSILILGSIGQWMGVLEFQDSNRKGARLQSLNQTALASSNEGIIVTDPLGQLQRSNAVFQQFFALKIDGDEILSLEAWLQGVQRQLLMPETVMAWSRAVTEHTQLDIQEQVQLSNGKYIRVYSKPIFEGEINHGRIWFFKDVTVSQRQKALMEQQQSRLRRQNEMLLALSTDVAMQTGTLSVVAPLIARETAMALPALRAAVWRADAQRQTLHCERMYNAQTGLYEQQEPLQQSAHLAYFQALSTERIVSLSSQGTDPASLSLFESALYKDRPVHVLQVPLRLGGQLYGILSAERKVDAAGWSLEDQQFLASIGDVLVASLAAGERRKAEKDLGDSAAILQAVFELAGVGILVTRPNRTVLDCNNTYLAIFGMTRDFVLYSEPDVVIAKSQALVQDADSVADRMKFLQDNPHENRYEPIYFKDGRILETFTEVLRVDGQIIGRVWFYRDVTERTAAEQRLRASELRNKAIIDAIPDLMLRISGRCEILDLKMPEVWEGSPVILDAKAQTVRQLLPLELAEAIMSQASMVFAEPKLAWHEQAIELDGILRDFETRIAPSGPGEVLIMLRDVTERKKTEKELIQRNHELDSFVYRASHDLKAPLNSLMGLIDIIKSESQEPQLANYLHLMDKSVIKLDTFIRNLTDFSRINRLGIQNQVVDFEKLIAEVNEGLQYMQNAEGIARHFTLKATATFYGDNFHLSIVLSNLISNAIKYFDARKPHPKVDVDVDCTSTACTITVTDNGVGIPKMHQDRIFELFYRATNQSFGSGIGLYITRNAIEKMGGTVKMESEEGVGTRFTISLPNQAVVLS